MRSALYCQVVAITIEMTVTRLNTVALKGAALR